jgi:hypothetical protein
MSHWATHLAQSGNRIGNLSIGPDVVVISEPTHIEQEIQTSHWDLIQLTDAQDDMQLPRIT